MFWRSAKTGRWKRREQAYLASLGCFQPLNAMGWGGVDLTTYRCRIGLFAGGRVSCIGMFHRTPRSVKAAKAPFPVMFSRRALQSGRLLLLGFLLFLSLRATSLTCHGDVERNPGPADIDAGDRPSCIRTCDPSGGFNSNSN